jgi:hypothetical protein
LKKLLKIVFIVFGIFGISVVSCTSYTGYKMANPDDSAKEFAAAIIKQTLVNWEYRGLLNNAAENFSLSLEESENKNEIKTIIAQTKAQAEGDVKNLFSIAAEKLGKFERMDEIKCMGVMALTMCHANTVFSKQSAVVRVSVVQEDGQYKVYSFDLVPTK